MNIELLEQALQSSLEVVESLEEEADVELLDHLLPAGDLLAHLPPASAKAAEGAGPEEEVGEVGEDAEAGEVDPAAVAVPEEALGHVELEGHEREVAHEEHQPQDRPDQPPHVREELVHLVEGPFEDNFGAGFGNFKNSINSLLYRDSLF